MWDGSSGSLCLEKRANMTALKKQEVRVAHMESDPTNIMEQVLEEISKLVKVDLLVTVQTIGVLFKVLVFLVTTYKCQKLARLPLYCISVLYNNRPVVVF